MIGHTIRVGLMGMGLAVAGGPAHAHRDPTVGIEHAHLLGTLNLQGQLFHVQGVDMDSRHIWVTSVDGKHQRGYLHEFDRATGQFVRRLELTDGPRFHPGGLSIASHSIWVPVAEYRANSSAVLEQIDIDSLQIRRKIPINDHLGCVAATDETLVAGNWDSKRLYLIDLNHDSTVRVVTNPFRTRYQDMKFIAGQLVAGGYINRHGGTIDWIDFPSMKLVRTLRTGSAGHGKPFGHGQVFTGEGMTLQGNDLYLLPENRHRRLFHFQLDDTVGRSVTLRQTRPTGFAASAHAFE